MGTKKDDLPTLILYYFPSCIFCYRVLRYLSERGIYVEKRDTMKNPTYLQELVSVGGKTQVPCLVIDGDALYESEDIVDWFETNLDYWDL